jgi:hypothetical protein
VTAKLTDFDAVGWFGGCEQQYLRPLDRPRRSRKPVASVAVCQVVDCAVDLLCLCVCLCVCVCMCGGRVVCLSVRRLFLQVQARRPPHDRGRQSAQLRERHVSMCVRSHVGVRTCVRVCACVWHLLRHRRLSSTAGDWRDNFRIRHQWLSSTAGDWRDISEMRLLNPGYCIGDMRRTIVSC